MHEIHLHLQRLTEYLDENLTIDYVLSIVCPDADDEAKRPNSLSSLNPMKVIKSDPNIPTILMELCTECRVTLESQNVDLNEDGWPNFVKFLNPEQLTGLFLCWIEYYFMTPINYNISKMGILTSRAYCLLLATPAALTFGAFHPFLMQRVFDLIVSNWENFQSVRGHEQQQLLVNISTLLEDVEMLLERTNLSDEHEVTKEKLIGTIAKLIQKQSEIRYSTDCIETITQQYYRILNALCFAAQGEFNVNLNHIMDGTDYLYRFGSSPIPISMERIPPTTIRKYSSIFDWFIKMLHNRPDETSEVLTNYIHSKLTTTDSSTADQYQRNLDVAAAYDAAMFTICNRSIVPYLERLVIADEIQLRINAVDMIGKMLAIDSTCYWLEYRNHDSCEVNPLPREIKLIELLFNRVRDPSNTVKVKAMASFVRVTNTSNRNCKRILKLVFNSTISSEEKELNNGTESIPIEHLEQLFAMKESCVSLLQNNFAINSAHVRRATLLFLEYISTTEIQLDDLLKSSEIDKLTEDHSQIVRKQLILTIDTIMNANQLNQSAIEKWVSIILLLALDTDPKIMEIVANSVKKNIFDKILRYDQNNESDHTWKLIKQLLTDENSENLKYSCRNWVKQQLVTQKTLDNIKTHIRTGNATEAWKLLSIIAPMITIKNPEWVKVELARSMEGHNQNLNDTSYYQLLVLNTWLENLNQHSQNELFDQLSDSLRTGSCSTRNEYVVTSICLKIISKLNNPEHILNWINQIVDCCEKYLTEYRQEFIVESQLENERFLNYLAIYSNLIADVPKRKSNKEIFNSMITFVESTFRLPNITIQSLNRRLEYILLALTRLTLFHPGLAASVIPLFGKALNSAYPIQLIIFILNHIKDLCCKYTSNVELILPCILSKSQDNSEEIRIHAMTTLTYLLVSDFLKLRGSILICFLLATLDTNPVINELAIEVLLKYSQERKTLILSTCLLECVFIFNGHTLENFEMFSTVDSRLLIDKLSGQMNTNRRREIYSMLIYYTDKIPCYMYFENIHLVMDKLNRDPKMKTESGLEAIRDMLFVCSEILRRKPNQQKMKKGDCSEEDPSNTDETEVVQNTTPTGRTSVGRRKGPTIAHGLNAVEKVIPVLISLHAQLCEIDDSFDKSFELLCKAICLNFEQFIEFAEPVEFWNKYKS